MEDVRLRGLEFEKFLNRLFDLFDLEPRLIYQWLPLAFIDIMASDIPCWLWEDSLYTSRALHDR